MRASPSPGAVGGVDLPTGRQVAVTAAGRRCCPLPPVLFKGRTGSEGDSSGEPVTLTGQYRSRWEEIAVLTPAAAGGTFLQGGVTFYPGFRQTKISGKTRGPVVSASSRPIIVLS